MRRFGLLALFPVAVQMCSAPVPWDIVYTQTPAVRGDGGRLVLRGRDGSSRVLTPDFHSAADPAVSFDGKRILFAGKKQASDRWDIYEMDAAGAGVRRITRDFGNCRSPIYQSPIFYLDDPAPAEQIAFVSDAAGESSTALYSARMDGSKIRRLTYSPSGALDPEMLPDGRMLFSAGRLFGVNIDGTDYAALSGGQGRAKQLMSCVTAKRQIVFVEPDAASRDGAGPLATLSLRRNLHSYKRLTMPAEGAFYSPSPLPDGTVLVARRPAGNSGTHGVYRLDPATRKFDLLFDTPGSHEIQPRALVPREVPDGRSSVVDEKEPWAKLYCLNLYESDLDAGVWKKGLVKRVRLLEGRPVRLIGEFDVDEDGSFNVQLPANLPFQIQALDEDGMALRTSAWIWAKNKEQRGCIGCHEDGERSPENVMATALTRPSINLMLAPERRRTVDFKREIAPVLKLKCETAACHAGKGAPFGSAYVTPGKARTSPLVWAISGRNTSRPWDAAPRGAAPAKQPPAHSALLTPSERRAIIEWIDLGAGGRR